MPLTNAQKILAWGSAGLMATASALGVMFYSPTILEQNHILNQYPISNTVNASSKLKSNYKSKTVNGDIDSNGSGLSQLGKVTQNDLSISKAQGAKDDKNTSIESHIGSMHSKHGYSDFHIYGSTTGDLPAYIPTHGYGNYWSGSPKHTWQQQERTHIDYDGWPYWMHGYTFNTFAHRGIGYDSYIGYYHTYLAQRQLENSDPGANSVFIDQLPNDQPSSSQAIRIKYPQSATYIDSSNHQQTIDVYLTVSNIKYYRNWRGPRSIIFSKNLYNGFRYNGIKEAHIQYSFASNNSPIALPDDSYFQVNHLDGLSRYSAKQPKVSSYLDDVSANDGFMLNELTNTNGRTVNINDKTGQFVLSNNMTEKVIGKHSKVRKYPSALLNGHDVVGGEYNSYYTHNADHSVAFILPKGSSYASFTAGSGVGYGLFKPSTQITTKPKPYYCHLSPDKKSLVTNLTVGTHIKNREQLLGPKKIYGSRMSYSTFRRIVNGKHKVTKAGLKYWEKIIASCIVKPSKPQHHHYQTPTPTTRKPIKYLTKIKRASGKINNYSGGGILKKPDEDYNYHITGQMPVRTSDNTKDWYKWSDKYGQHKRFVKYYDGHTNDNYVVEDHVPSYLEITKTPTINVGGKNIKSVNGTSHDVKFTFNNSDMDNYSGQVYNAIIPVKDADNETDSTNHLPKPNKAGWLTIWNGGKHINNSDKGHATDAFAYGTIYGKTMKHDYTNTVPVELKEIKANIWHYDYNHDHNMVNDGYDNFFPDYEQPMGIMNDIFDPTNISFKNYRFSRFFNSTQQPQTSQSGTKTFDSAKHAGLLQRDTHYWYAGTYHDINTANAQTTKNIDGNSQYLRYRFIYPSLSGSTNDASDMNPFDVNTFKNKIDSINDAKSQDHIADGSDHVAMNANPDDGNYYKGGFNENRYMPYFIPRVSLNQNIDPQTGKPESGASNNDGFRMVIDTDKAQHGLPFRINMKSQNILYGRHYYDDFKNVNVEMNVSDSNTHKSLYENIRPLVGESSKALIHRGIYHKHSYTYNESPDGSKNYNNHTGRWHGYAEASALGDHYYNGNYDLDTRGGVYSPGQRIPIHVSFNLVYGKYQGNNPRNYHPWHNSDSAPEVDMQDFNTHAYISNNPTLNHNDFGKNHVTGDADQDHNGDLPKAQSDRATFIEPERTIEYGSNPKGDNVRELKEQLSATQPRNAVGKTGYGINANDFGLDYRGHLEASDYAHKGTNMQFAFPEAFNTKDSNISYKHDTRDHSLLADNLLHVEPNYDYDYANENFGLPSYLDTHNNNSDDVNTDSEFESTFPEHLSTGDFSTTYGFYPRETINEDSNGKNNNTNNGNIALSSDADSYPYNGQGSDGSSYNDPSISNLGNSDKAYGLKTTNHDVDNNSNNEYAHTISTDGQNERMFTPLFLQSGNYPNVFHRAFENTNSTNDRDHRLGGNFFDIDENRPIKLVGHQYISKNDRPRDQKYDELSLQPILTNPENGLMQTPISNPAFPTQSSSLKDGWLTDNLWSGMYGSHTALLR